MTSLWDVCWFVRLTLGDIVGNCGVSDWSTDKCSIKVGCMLCRMSRVTNYIDVDVDCTTETETYGMYTLCTT